MSNPKYKRFFFLVMVILSGFNVGLQSSAIKYDLPVEGEWWKLCLSIFFTGVFGAIIFFQKESVV